MTQELACLRWTLDNLAARQKSDAPKRALAARLRQEAARSVKQIAERLLLGKPKGARTNVHRFMNRSETGSAQTQLDFQGATKTKGRFYGLTPPTGFGFQGCALVPPPGNPSLE